MSTPAAHYVVRLSDVAYPLDLTDGTTTGYANERSIEVYGPLGYSTDRVATLAPGQHGAEQKARVMAAALSGCAPDDVPTDHRYWYRTGRNASTPTETGVRFTPACRISRREHNDLIWGRGDHAETLAAIEQALALPHRSTAKALADADAAF